MRMFDIIKKKRDGFELSDEEIEFFLEGYIDGTIPNYQVSALLMAIYYKGMSTREIVTLTKGVANSGEKVSFSKIKDFKVDKHSTGGVGDKISLIVTPIAAACGIKVAKISGRALGHTGGTIDKLESIPGYRTNLDLSEFQDIVNNVGVSIVGQSLTLAPADRKLYALRDVTATVDSLPLIASSIMGKKLAVADNAIVLEVTAGSGSFNKTIEEARKLSKIMVDIGNESGKKTIAIITDMNQPLGTMVGNSLEILEALEVLKCGKGDKRLVEISLILAANMLYLAGYGEMNYCHSLAQQKLEDGSAYQKFYDMVLAHGGDVSYLEDTSKFNLGKTKEVKSPKEGYIQVIDTESYGMASTILGAGRNKIGEDIDPSAGIEVIKTIGDYVYKGDVIAILHANNETLFDAAEAILQQCIIIGEEYFAPNPIFLGRIE